MSRLRHDPETRAYAQRRKAQGLSTKYPMRFFKRHVVRQLYKALIADLPDRLTSIGALLLGRGPPVGLARGPLVHRSWALRIGVGSRTRGLTLFVG